MTMRTLFKAVGLLVLLSIFVPAQNASAVKEYYSISRSIRAQGMGGAFYGLSDDENALFYNPAGLAFYDRGKDLMGSIKIDGSTSIIPAISTLMRSGNRSVSQVITDLEAYQGNPLYANVTPFFGYYLRKYFAAGLLLGDTKTTFALLGRDIDTSADFTVISDSGLFLGFAYPIIEGLAVGVNAKGMFRVGGQRTYTVLEIAQNTGFSDIMSLGGAGGGIDFDLGVTYQLPTIVHGVTNRVSLVANNLLASPLNMFRLNSTTNAPPGLARMITLAGYTRLPGFWKIDHINLLLDLAEFQVGGQSNADLGARGGSLWKHVNFGAEGSMFGWLYGRMGFRQGNFTIGAGIDARFFQIDISTYAEELANLPGRLSSRRVALRLAAGFGGAKPAVASATKTQDVLPPVELKPPPPGAEAPKALEIAPDEPKGEPHGQNGKTRVEDRTTVSYRS